MIFIDRSKVDIPPVLIEADDGRQRGGKKSAAKEMRKAMESLAAWLIAGKDKADWSFKFEIYKHDQVKTALEKLFHGKCAYCETRYAAIQPMDVEHWRPKGQVELEDGSAKKPAYYWLAASWDNLLPSCIDCNRKRKQIDAVSGNVRSLGKKDRFPIQLEANRAAQQGGEFNEMPLLLNPCSSNPKPEDILKFTDDAVVTARISNGIERKMADASILAYGLNRSELVLNRREHLNLVRLHIATIKSLAQILIEHPDLPEDLDLVIDELILQEMRFLVESKDAAKPYSLLSRQIIDAHMHEFVDLGLDHLLDGG
ncbi:MAG: hypothetical protein OEU50_15015 [Gammaproteobacteria bacterium]|nr:hypothetical protein [Gammaproteobacteria bacterium]